MVDSSPVNGIDISMFQQCRNTYKDASVHSTSSLSGNVALQACKNFCENIEKLTIQGKHFNLSCMELCIYLNYINQYEENRNIYCMYFNYKIHELKENFNLNCDSVDECYNEMIKKVTNGSWKIPDVCKGYINGIDEKTFNVMKNLDELYKNLDYICNGDQTDDWCTKCNETYKKLLCISRNEKRINLSPVLQKFTIDFNSCNKCSSFDLNLEVIESNICEITERAANNMLSRVERTESEEIIDPTVLHLQNKDRAVPKTKEASIAIEVEKNIDTNRSTVIRLFATTVVITFAVLIMIFILYKYSYAKCNNNIYEKHERNSNILKYIDNCYIINLINKNIDIHI
ncbi:variable surface protein [Plasmodium gonderi]|uniref:Variable surface protein n=1 Tax=Plasmodium gonderi TaxID=77519 RepID=A0A1Y1JV38_PLAGO|nr:variable surface protein [Plasmodium gonderi]GAW84612.1 variable surface protein [Plasmodium gonderi]